MHDSIHADEDHNADEDHGVEEEKEEMKSYVAYYLHDIMMHLYDAPP